MRDMVMGAVPAGLALAVRLHGLNAGLPQYAHVDERTIVTVLAHLWEGAWDPGFYRYPSLVFLLVDGAVSLRGSFADVLVTGRSIMAALSVLTTVLLVVHARLLGMSRAAGVVAATAFALSPLAIVSSGYINTDAPLTAAVLGALIVADRLDAHRTTGWFVGFAVLVGVAVSAKYSAAVLVPAWILHALLRSRRDAGDGDHVLLDAGVAPVVTTILLGGAGVCALLPAVLPMEVLVDAVVGLTAEGSVTVRVLDVVRSLRMTSVLAGSLLLLLAVVHHVTAARMRIRLTWGVLVLPVVVLVVFLLLNPFALLSWRAFLYDVAHELSKNISPRTGAMGTAYVGWYVATESVLLGLLAVPGMVLAARRGMRIGAPVLFVVLALASMLPAQRGFARYLLPLLPVLLLFGSHAAVECTRLAWRRHAVAGVVVLACLAGIGGYELYGKAAPFLHTAMRDASSSVFAADAESARQGLHYDEAVTLLAATGHLEDFDQRMRAGGTVEAGELQRLLRPNSLRSWSELSHDLAVHDIHPPLYFWVLHHWLLATGGHVALMRIPNLLFAAVTALIVFVICLRLSGGRHQGLAAVCALLWLLPGGTLGAVFFLRQYALLMLVCVLALLLLVGMFHGGARRWGRLPLLFAVLTAGVLTQYQFIGVFAVVTILLLLHAVREGVRREAVMVVLWALLSLVVLVVLTGDLAGALAQPLHWVERSDSTATLLRLRAVGATVYGLVFGSLPVPLGVGIVMVVGVVFVGYGRGMLLRAAVRRIGAEPLPLAAVLTVLVVVVGPYLAGFTPMHAMNARYLLMLPPLLMVLVFQLPRSEAERRVTRVLLAGYVLIVGGPGVAGMFGGSGSTDAVTAGLRALDGSERVIVSGSGRDVVLPYVRLLPSSVRVLPAGDVVPSEGEIARHLSGAERVVYFADASGWSGAADTSRVHVGIEAAGYRRVQLASYKTRHLHMFVIAAPAQRVPSHEVPD